MRTVKISRRAFLTGLGLASTAALLSACNTVPASSHSGAAPSQPDSEAPSSSAASEMPAQPILSVDEFPITDGSTACIPLIAQIMADTTGLDLETARSAVTTNTTAQAWRNLGLYGNNYGDSVKLIIAYEAPESVKEEMAAEGGLLDQKAIGRDALVFIVNEENPVQSLSQQQLRDIYAGKITNWKDVGGADLPIVAFQRREDSGSQTLFQKLLIQGGELMDAPTELAPTRPAAAGRGRRDPLGRHHRGRELSPVQRVLCRSPAGFRPRHPGAQGLRLALHRRGPCLHREIGLCGRAGLKFSLHSLSCSPRRGSFLCSIAHFHRWNFPQRIDAVHILC